MTDPKPTVAHIARKGLDSTGFTEDHAAAAARRIGSHGMMIVEYVVKAVTKDDTGQSKVALNLTHVEPVPVEHEDAVREVQRALYRSRPDQEGQAVLTGAGGDGPTVGEAIATLQAGTTDDEDAAGPSAGETEWDGTTDGPLTADNPGDDEGGAWPGDEDYVEPDAAPDGEPQGASVTTPDFTAGKAKKRG